MVVHLADFDLTFFLRFEDRVGDGAGSGAERYLSDCKRFIIHFLNLCSNLHGASSLAIIIAAHIDKSARREVRIEREFLPAKVGNARIQNLIKIMGQNLRRQADGNALHALSQQQRELHRQMHRLLLAPVVARGPFRNLRTVKDIERKRTQTCLNVTPGSRRVARQDVAPVALSLNQKLLLTQLNQRILDRCVAMRMILHGVAHDVGHLVKASVVEGLHRVENAPLHRLEAVFNRGHGALKNHVAGIIKIPAAIH